MVDGSTAESGEEGQDLVVNFSGEGPVPFFPVLVIKTKREGVHNFRPQEVR